MVVTIVTIIFLMYTHNDKQVTSLKSALKKILITVVIFLTLGSVYTYLMGRAKNDDWDPNVPMSNSEPAPPDKDGNHTAY